MGKNWPNQLMTELILQVGGYLFLELWYKYSHYMQIQRVTDAYYIVSKDIKVGLVHYNGNEQCNKSSDNIRYPKNWGRQADGEIAMFCGR